MGIFVSEIITSNTANYTSALRYWGKFYSKKFGCLLWKTYDEQKVLRAIDSDPQVAECKRYSGGGFSVTVNNQKFTIKPNFDVRRIGEVSELVLVESDSRLEIENYRLAVAELRRILKEKRVKLIVVTETNLQQHFRAERQIIVIKNPAPPCVCVDLPKPPGAKTLTRAIYDVLNADGILNIGQIACKVNRMGRAATARTISGILHNGAQNNRHFKHLGCGKFELLRRCAAHGGRIA